ncbi:LapA family protein [Mucilaginibacter robiniae]|uniref:LapA family protein n=1 Tax=Mucilaginibacter robiniae TaxID=2728022 RepID=A0A7L5E295_9SPHI|nr:LapA family protein [Mucilaginibacter robiniae]QJD97490.1 LapA family protein [Mucilaginibacter robiniae]
MSFKTIIAIIITIALTITIMQNPEPATFTILFVPVTLPKLIMLTSVSVGGFLLGVLVSRPKRNRYSNHPYPNDEDEDNDDGSSSTLSDEDREYIS